MRIQPGSVLARWLSCLWSMPALFLLLLMSGIVAGSAVPAFAADRVHGQSSEVKKRTETEIRFGLTPVILHDRLRSNQSLGDYLGRRLGKKVTIVQRQTYRQIMDLLAAGQIDVAWICGLPYVRNMDWLELVAVPRNGFNQGRPMYRSLVIVAADSEFKSFQDLRDRVYAFADPDSNSGHLVPRFMLANQGSDPDNFFRVYMFTNSHRNVVRAVSQGVADGGSVDSYVLRMMQIAEPDLAGKVRIIERSDEYAFPPIVARKSLDQADIRKIRKILLNMEMDAEGRPILDQLHINGFERGDPEMYRPIAVMDQRVLRTAAREPKNPELSAKMK